MLKVILVDDEIWVRRDLETLLGDHEQIELVGSFADGREALRFLREHPCDVVFTDLRMGRMGGRQLIAACANEHIDVYMVIISAYSDFNAAREGIQYGVLDYLLKPVSKTDFAQLLSRIDERMHAAPRRSPDSDHIRAIESAYPVCRVLCFPMQRGDLRARLTALTQFGEDYALYVAEQTQSGFAVALLGSSLCDPPPQKLPEGVGMSTVQKDFSSLERMIVEAMRSAQCGFRFAASELVSSIQSYIVRSYEQPLTLDALAAKFFLNKTYMCSAFRNECGMTLISFITSVRMRMAAAALAETRASVQEIASGVGYADSAYFSRLFKKAYGLSPEAYRRETVHQRESVYRGEGR